MDIYIIRHGFPDYARDCLTNLGHRQAEAVAEALEALGIDEIYSSPMGRARETAAHLAERLGKPVAVEPWAHELDGWVSLADGSPVDVNELLRSDELRALGDRWLDHPQIAATNVRDVVSEIDGGVLDLLRRQGFVPEGDHFRAIDPARPNDKNIALFCHVGVKTLILSSLLRVPLPFLVGATSLHTCAFTRVLVTADDVGRAEARIVASDVTDHLSARGLEFS